MTSLRRFAAPYPLVQELRMVTQRITVDKHLAWFCDVRCSDSNSGQLGKRILRRN